MNNTIVILPTGCTRFNHTVNIFCLPKKVSCDKTIVDGIFTACGESWCKICNGDQKYYVPVPENAKIMLQTNFNKFDNSTGWGDWINIAVLDKNGDELEIEDFISRKITGRSKKHSYQTVEIDISKIPETCFSFKITATGEDPLCTQIFKKENCQNLVEIESVFNDYDCWNNYYGQPVGTFSGDNFQYSNKLYLKGLIKLYSTGPTEEILRFIPGETVAPFMAKYITNKWLNAKTIKLNGTTYKNTDSKLTAREITNMFWPVLEFKNPTCKTSSKCDMD